MPRRKPKPERVVQEQIKASLDAILSDDEYGIQSVSTDHLPRLKRTDVMDFKTETLTTGTEARALLTSMVKYYLDANFIENSDYVQYKIKIDSMNVSSMMLQLKTAQHAITKLLEEIDMGNANPRMFEVLAQLQSQIMQMPKDYQNYMEKMEDGYKKITLENERKEIQGSFKMESDSNSPESYGNNTTENGGLRVRGTKGLMEGLRTILGAEIEVIKIENENENSVVNAKKKAQLDASRNVVIDEDDEYKVDEELFR